MGLLSERSEDDEEHGELNITGLEDLDSGGVDDLVYELDDWSDRARTALRERLETLGVPHEWEGTSLVTAASDEAWVERIMDQVEDELSLELDPDADQIAYDLSGWDLASRDRLFELLEAEAVAYGFDDDELFVRADDEQHVDELVESVIDPGRAGTGPTPGPELMGQLFVAADRLAHDPVDHEGTLSLIDALRAAASAPTPYGMDEVWWDAVIAHAERIVALLDAPAADLDGVVDEAASLRDHLRPYV